MSQRERAHPWWRDPLPPFDAEEMLGSRQNEVTVTMHYGPGLTPCCPSCALPWRGHVFLRIGSDVDVYCPEARHG